MSTMVFVIIGVLLLVLALLILLSVMFFAPVKFSDDWKRPVHKDYVDENTSTFFKSGRNKLLAHIYGKDNVKGTVIFSHGMGVPSDYYIPEARYLAKIGYRSILFDDTGYWKNKGIFLGFPRAAKDLTSAIKYFDNGTPVILMGHSMGAYAVCTALPEVKSKVSAVVVYSGFDNEHEIIREFVNSNIKYCKKLVACLLSISQVIIFPASFFRSALDCLKKSGCKALIIHGNKDDEILLDGASIYNHVIKVKSPCIMTRLIKKEGANTHMGVVRPSGTLEDINEEVFPEVVSFIDEVCGCEKSVKTNYKIVNV